jgi:hypothetical protein
MLDFPHDSAMFSGIDMAAVFSCSRSSLSPRGNSPTMRRASVSQPPPSCVRVPLNVPLTVYGHGLVHDKGVNVHVLGVNVNVPVRVVR